MKKQAVFNPRAFAVLAGCLALACAMYFGARFFPAPSVVSRESVSVASPETPPASFALGAPAAPASFGASETENPRRRAADAFQSKAADFSIHRMGAGNGPTLLVIGGIQGDEPGGFSAAALLAGEYTITKGSVWVVPDLNFAGILQRSRGVFGDMNRKFAALAKSDPEYALVTRLKSVLLDERVDLILNLHDGSGFYRPTHIDAMHNPTRWGQSVIIDQETLGGANFGDLLGMAKRAAEDANAGLLDEEHRYHIRNTNTRMGDREMEKTLSYFAVLNRKPAFGLEAGKSLNTEGRAYYHLLLLESFMRQMGIEFQRNFALTPQGVLAALNSDLAVAVYSNKLVLPLDDARPTLNFVPFKKNEAPDARASRPLLALVSEKNGWRVAYGNRTLTRVTPQFMDFDDTLENVELEMDGKSRLVPFGEVVPVAEEFIVRPAPGCRVNVIGAQKEANGSEGHVPFTRTDFAPDFSVDTSGTTYRVEVYKGKAFAGMVLVRFGDPAQAGEALTSRKGPESALGF